MQEHHLSNLSTPCPHLCFGAQMSTLSGELLLHIPSFRCVVPLVTFLFAHASLAALAMPPHFHIIPALPPGL